VARSTPTASRIEIITIGDELIEGRLVDTNAGELSAELADIGLRVAEHRTVGDDIGAIVEALRTAAGRADAVLVSGGLGPTTDDLTAIAAARAFGLEIERSPIALEHTRRFFADRGRTMAPSNEKQADLPAGCTILPNPEGTAVGFAVDADGCRLYFMPGVPRELRRMAADSVLPDLRVRLDPLPQRVATLKVFGRGESDVAQSLVGFAEGLTEGVHVTVQYRATFPEIHIRLVVDADDPDAGREALDRLTREAHRRLGRHVFAVGGAQLHLDFPGHAVDVLGQHGLNLAAAEVASCGRVAQLLGRTSDGARCFAGGLTAPTDLVLAEELSCDAADAEAVAAAIRDRFRASLGVAVLGAAVGTEGRPPGELTVAAVGPAGSTRRDLRFPIDPDRFQLLAAYAALRLALSQIDQPS